MSYGSLVSIESSFEVDTSNLDERLDSMQETIDGLDGMSEEKVNDLIDSEISSRNLVSSSDYDFDNIDRRISDLDDLEEKVENLEGASVDNERLADLEARIEKLEGTSVPDPDETLAVLEEQQKTMELIVARIEKLEASRSRDASIVDLLRQLARALVG